MIVRIDGGADDIEIYLVHGKKAGRDYTRDQLDTRVELVGDLQHVTDVYKSIPGGDDKERYYHITLGFKELDTPVELMQLAVNSLLKEIFGAAYRPEEYAVYAEAHIPKILSYVHSQTGDPVSRFPHVHVIIPKINLLDGSYLNIFGKVDFVERYLDAWQEGFNNEFSLASPKKNRRANFGGKSELISRVKKEYFDIDGYVEKRKKLVSEILAQVIERDIVTVEAFQSLLKEYGSTQERNSKKAESDRYQHIVPHGEKTGFNLTDKEFRHDFITLTTAEKLERIKEGLRKKDEDWYKKRTDPEYIVATKKEWREVMARRMKYINSGNKKLHARFSNATYVEKVAILNEIESKFYQQFAGNEGLYGITADESRAAAFGIANRYLRDAGSNKQSDGRAIAVDEQAIRANVENIRVFADPYALELGKSRRQGYRTGESRSGPEKRRIDSEFRQLKGKGLSDDYAAAIAAFSAAVRETKGHVGEVGAVDRSLELAARTHRANLADASEAAGYRDRRHGRGTERAAPSAGLQNSVVDRLIREDNEQRERPRFENEMGVIKRELSAALLLARLSYSHGVNPDDHPISTGADGADRIQFGQQKLNVSDFLTRALRIPYKEAAPILRAAYAHQLGDAALERAQRWSPALFDAYKTWGDENYRRWRGAIDELDLRKKTELASINQDGTARRWRLHEKPMNYLQRRAHRSLIRVETAAALMRKVAEFERERDAINERYPRGDQDKRLAFLREWSQAGNGEALLLLRAELAARSNEPVAVNKASQRIEAVPGQKPAAVMFTDLDYQVLQSGDVIYKLDGVDAFRDATHHVDVLREGDDLAVEIALRLALQKFNGSLQLHGDSEFQRSCVRIAVARGLRVANWGSAELEQYESELRLQQRKPGGKYGAGLSSGAPSVTEKPVPDAVKKLQEVHRQRFAVEPKPKPADSLPGTPEPDGLDGEPDHRPD